ncbi:MAG: type II toxin-antitoxin system CcdA family antitoxin [Rhodocyclales bacterium]|nr:type II toxin-antitoxin system CcdA family antitoxin [Rhodocyclales bacterium]
MRTAPPSIKKAVNLTINAALLDEAKALGINVSRTLEEALAERTRVAAAARWREENAEAIAWQNALTERMGGTLQELLDADDAV